jgi:hypothetical protein
LNEPQAAILFGFGLLVGGLTLFYVANIMSYSAQFSNRLGAELNAGKWYWRSRFGAVAALTGIGIVCLVVKLAGIQIG